MAVPTPTFIDRDFSNASVWTLVNGIVTSAENSFGFNAVKVTGDGVNDRATHLGTLPIGNGSGAQHTISCLFSCTNSSLGILMAQRNQGGGPTDAAWDIQIGATGLINVEFFSSLNSNNSINSQTLAAFNDGVIRHLLATVNGNNVNIYINGVETSYATQDNVSGTGFAAGVAGSGIGNLSVLGFGNSGFELIGECFSTKAWQGTTLTDAEAAEEADLELNGASNKMPIITPIMSSIYPTNGIINRDLYKST